MDKIRIDRMVDTDVCDVFKIANLLQLSVWSETDYKSEIKRDSSICLIAKSEKQTVGFLLSRLITSEPITIDGINTKRINSEDFKNNKINLKNKIECEIMNIGVRKEFQGRNVGSMLLENLLKRLPEDVNKIIWLEVRRSNEKAINFYRSKGFSFEYCRKNYYSTPLEDALVMRLEKSRSKQTQTTPRT